MRQILGDLVVGRPQGQGPRVAVARRRRRRVVVTTANPRICAGCHRQSLRRLCCTEHNCFHLEVRRQCSRANAARCNKCYRLIAALRLHAAGSEGRSEMTEPQPRLFRAGPEAGSATRGCVCAMHAGQQGRAVRKARCAQSGAQLARVLPARLTRLQLARSTSTCVHDPRAASGHNHDSRSPVPSATAAAVLQL